MPVVQAEVSPAVINQALASPAEASPAAEVARVAKDRVVEKAQVLAPKEPHLQLQNQHLRKS